MLELLMNILKPERLKKGDTVAAISLSSGAANIFPHRYEAGKRQFEEAFGVKVIETPHALASNEWLYGNPQARAHDLHWALENPEVKAIISTIGGDDSVRILPYLDVDLIRKHPKIFMGFSDTTISLLQYLNAGVVSINGPVFLTCFAENTAIHPYVQELIQKLLFDAEVLEYEAAPDWSEQFLDWGVPENQNIKRDFVENDGWNWIQDGIQDNKAVEGRLIGGCIEVFEFLKSTKWWPKSELWQDAILFFETSEEKPTPDSVKYWLRNYGSQGILNQVNALLFARPMSYSDEEKIELENVILQVLKEFDREDLLVVMNMDFGHTAPMMPVPLGVRAKLNPKNKSFALLESVVV